MPALPTDLRPMLAERAPEPFDSPSHAFGVRWACIRALAYVERARLRLVSQSGIDVSALFPELAGIAAQVRGDGVVLDGEVVALDDSGLPDLATISQRLAGGPADGGGQCIYQANDLLFASGLSLMAQPFSERRQALAKVLDRQGPAIVAEYVDGEGLALFEAAVERRLPGIVARDKAAPYLAGHRTRAFLEVPVYEVDDFVIGGYVLGLGREEPVAGLLLGEPAATGRLRYVGLVAGNLPDRLLEPLLAPLTTDICPFLNLPALARLVYWLRPEMVCQARYARRESDGSLRFPVFVAMRPDLRAGDLAATAGARRAPGL
jgi:bifunctional non-homologous end joining protein LigD